MPIVADLTAQFKLFFHSQVVQIAQKHDWLIRQRKLSAQSFLLILTIGFFSNPKPASIF